MGVDVWEVAGLGVVLIVMMMIVAAVIRRTTKLSWCSVCMCRQII